MAAASPDVPPPVDSDLAARAKALGSPLRWRVLRLCLHEARTNRELADRLGVNPATMLHHVRMLANTGYLEAQPARRGTRGAREIPYLATRRTWNDSTNPFSDDVIVATFLDEIQGVDPEDLALMRAGLMLTGDERDALVNRVVEIVREYLPEHPNHDATVEGRSAWSLFVALHPDALNH